MKPVLDLLKQAALLVMIGALVMSGMRLVEWVIPRPPSKLLVCMVDDTGTVEVCKSLDELSKRGVQM